MSIRSPQYLVTDIQVLEGLEAVRRLPGMYIGSTDQHGLHQLIYELVYNSVDEFLAGFCNLIRVKLLKGGWVRVEDNGRGIPIETHPDTGLSGVETVFTRLHAGAKFGGKAYAITGGLHGVGASVVNALSSRLKVEVRRGGEIYFQEYRRGKPITPLKRKGRFLSGLSSGTTVTFLPDKAIFGEISYDLDSIVRRLKELSYLNPGLRIELEDESSGEKFSFFFDSGIIGLLKEILKGKTPVHPEPIYLSGEVERTKIEACIQYCQEEGEGYSFANCINTFDGGSHLSGFRAGLTRAINDVARRNKWIKDRDPSIQGEDVREGLNFVLSVYLPDPQFEGQIKSRLTNKEVRGQVEMIVYEGMVSWLEGHPSEARRIIERVLDSARKREEERREREARKKSFELSILSGKLADCSEKDPQKCEIFIVEGESAGGSAKIARDRHFQAILPLRGKILNVEKASLERILRHEEIQAIRLALRVDGDDLSRLRYHRVIIMCDADVDGSHIKTLLLTFFYRQMPELIRRGHLYIAQPPLYRLKAGGKVVWVYSEEEKEAYLRELGEGVEIQRYKGLGEMNPDQLWQTTLNPKTRTLFKVEIRDAEKAEWLFRLLMGEEVSPRRQFILEQADKVKNLDV